MKLLQFLALGSALSLCACAFADVAKAELATTKKAATTTSSKKATTTTKKTTKSSHHHPSITSKPTTSHSNTGNATTFTPHSCKGMTLAPANPTANYTFVSGYPTPITVGIYTPSPSASPSLQLQLNGTRFQYKTVGSKGVYIIGDELGSLQINNDLSFELIAPHCSFAVTGTIPPPSSSSSASTSTKSTITKSTPTKTASAKAKLQRRQTECTPGACYPQVDVEMTLIDQCWDTLRGQSPHLLCYQSSPDGASSSTTPLEDFTEGAFGGGVYSGTCEIEDWEHDICEVGEFLCDDGVQGLIDKGVGLICGAIAGLLSDGFAAVIGEKICSDGFAIGLDAVCKENDLSKCKPAAVTPVVSMEYFQYYASYTTLITLPAVTATSTTLTTTATGLVPSCVASGNPFPSAQDPDCPYWQLAESYTSCNECYQSGIPWEQDIMWDIQCNTCCGCCYKLGTGNYDPTGSQSVCCSQDNYMQNPNCYQDFCQVELDSSRYQQDCSVVAAENICSNRQYDYGHPLLECPSPDFTSLFNPNQTWPNSGGYICNVGNPPPYSNTGSSSV